MTRQQALADVVERAGAWVWRELEADVAEWRSDRPVRRTIVGVLEMVFAIGILIRAGMHIGGVMIAHPAEFSEADPEVAVGLQFGHTVVGDLSLGVEFTTRCLAAVYALWWMEHWPSMIPLPPAFDFAVTAFIMGNLGFVVADPVWLVVDRLRR